jgi:hypothetical protein
MAQNQRKKMNEIPEDLLTMMQDLHAVLHTMSTPDDMLERINTAMEATKQDHPQFRLKLLMMSGLFIDDAMVDTPTLDKDSLIRIVANEFLMISAFLVRALKKRIGEEISPARFAVVAYTIANQVKEPEWNAKLAEDTLHDKEQPGALRAEIESMMGSAE